MAAGTLNATPPLWVGADAPDAAPVVVSQCTLSRNLDDFPFPGRCDDDEKRQIEERIVQVLDSTGLLANGQYYALHELDAVSTRFLAERRLITYELMGVSGAHGVYVSDDQTLSIMVNGLDHLCMRVQMAGNQLSEAWQKLSAVDDQLAGALDFAFDEKLGYLAALLDNAGTGLRAALLLHLPALQGTSGLATAFAGLDRQHVLLHGVRAGGAEAALAMQGSGETALTAPVGQGLEAAIDQALYSDLNGALSGPLDRTVGDLSLLVNRGTLGASEEELVFHLRHTADDLLEAERRARETWIERDTVGIEDRAGRALGTARGARLLGFAESLAVLSSLRLGVVANTAPAIPLDTLNQLLLPAQGAHLEIECGAACDGLNLCIERAKLFRARLA